MHIQKTFSLGVVLLATALTAQTVVKDINTVAATNPSSSPSNFATIGGITYFSASDGLNGVELWRTDGTPAGTFMVTSTFVVSSGKLFFSALESMTFRELYVSDGTVAGTTIVKDTNPLGLNGMQITTTSGIAPFGTGVLVALTDDTTTGEELWFSDGTLAGTVLVKDINALTLSSTPRQLTVAGSRVFFTATNGAANGIELWVTDGTLAGTNLVADIFPGTDSGMTISSPMTANGSSVIFQANNGTIGTEPYVSDGTTTTLLRDIALPLPANANPVNVVSFGGKTVFAATDGVSGIEPWVTDGTVAGTIPLGDLYPGLLSSSPANFTVRRICIPGPPVPPQAGSRPTPALRRSTSRPPTTWWVVSCTVSRLLLSAPRCGRTTAPAAPAPATSCPRSPPAFP